ncbi:hypothetical protein, partial [Bradyrhizobium sp. STM 3809]|uniref:hypothetical protein n=1 Tax=Bradyrhizobium sp. STM 3809 TaxID=551936 RepID=UPI001AEC51DE
AGAPERHVERAKPLFGRRRISLLFRNRLCGRSHDARIGGPPMRLRFYYPDAYAALEGDDAKARQSFEAKERQAIQGAARH